MADLPKTIQQFTPGNFDHTKHWYPKAMNAQIHPLVRYFMEMTKEQIATRYVYLNPRVKRTKLLEIFYYQPKHYLWGGTDLMHVTNRKGLDRMVLIESNSCPSGQKSFPLLNEGEEMGGYKRLIEQSFLPKIQKLKLKGVIAVFDDKNPMENTAYAQVISDLTKETVYYIPATNDDEYQKKVKIINNQIHIKPNGRWMPVRAVFRYVGQKPWNRLPIDTKTFIYNPIISCLAGGRNKLLAAKAYDFLNSELEGTGLKIQTPQTFWDLYKNEVAIWVEKMGYKAVVKIPYSNAGQGVFFIFNQKQLEGFKKLDIPYELYIVQQLIGHRNWSSKIKSQKLYQVGTIPTKNKRNIYVFDVRMVLMSTSEGYRPVALNARQAALPMEPKVKQSKLSEDINFGSHDKIRDMLLTNLSYKKEDGSWGNDDNRLLMMDRRDFNRLGLSLDDLIEGYVQSVMALVAIDKMAQRLINKKGKLKRRLYQSLNNDTVLLKEIMQ